MRIRLHIFFVFLLLGFSFFSGHSQIIIPTLNAGFGVDADLQSNYFNSLQKSGNDDWFLFPGSTGTGQAVIDTTDAANITSRYTLDPASRRLSFRRRMQYPVFTVLNDRLLMDAVFVRDFHGDDSTVFASGSNKNGDSPSNWSCPVSQGIPDKNDILDMVAHVRRAGPANADSLWMFGGLSLDNITGNRYFDFEMYQTNLSYDRTTRTFSGYGPDAGHTSWEFDAAGNVVKAGDIIFSAEYQNAALSMIEARIWINKASLNTTPVAFEWSGKFDGAFSGASFGYASIKPKANGTYFAGLQNTTATWGGPFSIVLQNDAVVTDYVAKQFVEFSVNLTKLGLDPVSMIAGNSCNMPFGSLLVKTRASSSFTAELKDFVLPMAFFAPAKAAAKTATPFLCDKLNIAEIWVSEPVSTSFYQWSTEDGNIVSNTTDPTIYVDKPGSYIVNQYLIAGCQPYATDTIQLMAFPFCGVLLSNTIIDFRSNFIANKAELSWKAQDNEQAISFDVQKSTDGIHFTKVATLPKHASSPQYSYSVEPGAQYRNNPSLHFRIELLNADGSKGYSTVLQLATPGVAGNMSAKIYPNPVKDQLFVQLFSASSTSVKVELYNAAGTRLFTSSRLVKQGLNTLVFPSLPGKTNGLGFVFIQNGHETINQKVFFAN